MLIKSIINNRSKTVKCLLSKDKLFIDCLCDMLENVEKQAKFTNDARQVEQLREHSLVVRKVLENNLHIG